MGALKSALLRRIVKFFNCGRDFELGMRGGVSGDSTNRFLAKMRKAWRVSSGKRFPKVKSGLRRSRFLALVALMLPFFCLGGQIFEWGIFARDYLLFPVMSPNTALAFVMAAISILFNSFCKRHQVSRTVSFFLGLIVALIGLWELIEYSSGAQFIFDQYFLTQVLGVKWQIPVANSIQSSAGLVGLGFAILMLGLKSRYFRLGQISLILVATSAYISASGYVFETIQLTPVEPTGPSFLGMSLCSTIEFLLLSGTLFLSYPDRELMNVLTNRTQSSLMARRVLLIGILIPPIVGCITKFGVMAGWYDINGQVAIFSLIVVLYLLRTTWVAANQAGKVEMRALSAFASMKRLNERLMRALNERQMFASLVENSSDFISISDEGGNLVYLNRAGRKLVGLPAHCEIEKTNISDYYYPDQKKDTQEFISRVLLKGDHWEGETYFRKWGSGKAIPVSDSRFIVRQEKTGRVLGIANVARDILEQQNRELEQKFLAQVGDVLATSLDYEDTIENIVQLAVRNIADFCIIYLVEDNGFVRRTKAVSRDPGKAWICEWLMSIPFDRTKVNPIDVVIESREPLLVENLTPNVIESISHSEEHLRALRALKMKSLMVAPLLVHGQLLGAMALVSADENSAFKKRDLYLSVELAQRAAGAIENARLYREARRANLIVNNLPAMIAYWDKDQTCRFANSVYLDWFGFTPQELVGLSMCDVIGEDLYHRNTEHIEGVLSGVKQFFEREIRLKSTDEVRHTSAMYIPDIQRGEVLGFFVLVTDITELKKAQIEAEREKEKSMEAVKMREQVLAIVSHDLKNPLASISLVAELLKVKKSDEIKKEVREPKQEGSLDYSSILERSVGQMSKLINDLLDFNRIQEATFFVNPNPVSFKDAIAPFVENVKSLAKAKDLKFEVDISPSLPDVLCDVDRIGQVLMNLLGNAIKFTPRGGEIKLETKETESKLIVSVCDTGIGISADQVARVFDCYWQVQATKHLGSGLGLAIAKGIVEAHGEKIWVESEEAKGSCFRFSLPISDKI